MTKKRTRTVAIMAILPFIQGIQPASAELPMMEQPWIGYFAVAESGAFQFLFSAQGSFEIMILNNDAVQIQPPINLQFLATETRPDGSVRELAMNPDTLESADIPTAKLKKTVFRCKLTDEATGQPTLEGTIEVVGRTILTSARITDSGAFDQKTILPVIRASFPPFYTVEKTQKETWDKKQIKEYEKRIGKDSVTLKHLDGTRVKLACSDNTNPKSKEVNGKGISSAEVEISAYQDRKIEFLAAQGSSLTMENLAPGALHDGFWFQWSSDPANDPQGKAKLNIRIK